MIGDIIKASKGKVFRRKLDGTIVGDEVFLGYIYIVNGEFLDEPIIETPNDYEEIDDPDYIPEEEEEYVDDEDI